MKKLTIFFLALTLTLIFASFSVAKEKDWGPNLLKADPKLELYVESDRKVPQYVSGNLTEAVSRGTEVTAVNEFLKKNRGAFKIDEPEKELVVRRIDEDTKGNQHIRLDQYKNGLRVIGGEMIAHFNKEGRLKVINGFYKPGIEISTTPSITDAAAVNIAVNDLADFFGNGTPQPAELVIYPWEGQYHLVWKMFLLSDDPPGRWEYFVDAHNGEIVHRANRIMEAEAIGTGVGVLGHTYDHIDTYYDGFNYKLIDYTRRANNDIHGHGGQMQTNAFIQTNVAGGSLPGTVATDADNYWDDPTNQSPAVDGQIYSCLVYDYWLSHFGRNSYTDNGNSMLCIVNYSGEGCNNAYWDGSRIVVWCWGAGWRSLAACPDVIAHEWGHAVTENCSNLVYEKEPGALNESFSDMMGAAFEFSIDTLDAGDWLMGENGTTGSGAFRYMAIPPVYGDPDIYETSPNWVDVTNCTPSYQNDYCGVHTNSGVGNKWFYLLSDGDTFNGVTVNGVGVQNAILIAYTANANYWVYSSGYEDAAIGTYYAAKDLDPTGQWAAEVALAWEAVGVNLPVSRLVFDYPTGLPETIEYGHETEVQTEVSGFFEGVPESGSGELHYAINGGAYTTVPMTEVSSNLYSGMLPAVTDCSDTLKYFFSAQDTAGEVFYSPADTLSPYTPFVVTNIITFFADDFESDLGWTVDGDATDGQWDRGVPAGGGDRGDPPTDFDGSGQCFLTDNVDGNSDVDNGATNLYSPTFDLTDQDARIIYARWYTNDCGSAPDDSFKVYLSNNNGSSWTLVDVIGPNDSEASGGWNKHAFWVSDFMTGTDQMKLRFVADDNNTSSCIEAAVDGVEVVKYDCKLWYCGDVNCSDTEEPDISDIVRLIDYLYLTHDPLCNPVEAADVNGSGGEPDIGDITQLIGHLYIDGRALTCP